MATQSACLAEAGKKCCFKKCLVNPSRVIAAEDSRVEVRAFESKKKSTVVIWNEGGTAVFHYQCWWVLVKATRDARSPLGLSDVERSMIIDAFKTAEYHDSVPMLAQEAERVANILKNSTYCIAFTGAGISTAAGIGDFRGIDGKWTEREKKKNYGARAKPQVSKNKKSLENLRPTYTHEALLKLMDIGLLKFVISQNTDGLHRLSGIPAERIAELHGNTFVEKCEDCGTRYERTHGCRRLASGGVEKKCKQCHINHRTGRKCEQKDCGGHLINTIINFGDYLEKDILSQAQCEAKKCDVVLALGSTLKVTPASSLVSMGQQPSRLIICNRQITDNDMDCLAPGPDQKPLGARVFGDCDSLMQRVMAHLLPADDLKAWEGEREERLAKYGMKRTTLPK